MNPEVQPHAPWQIALIAARGATRCGARRKYDGKPCQGPAMANGRCRLHGGKSPGAPKGNQNALKHGYYTREAIQERREARVLLQGMLEVLGSLDGDL